MGEKGYDWYGKGKRPLSERRRAGSRSAVGGGVGCGARARRLGGHESSSVGGCGATGSASGRMEVGNRVGWGWVIESGTTRWHV